MYNELLAIIEENEKNERNWEKIIESEEEGAQINMVKMETLDKKMENKQKKFEEKLKQFEKATKNETDVQAEIRAIVRAVEDIREKAQMLDRKTEEANQELEKGHKKALDELETNIEKERENTEKELRKLRDRLT